MKPSVPSRLNLAPVLALCLALVLPMDGKALTVYRIGGEDRPAPAATDFGVPPESFRFEQRPWDSYRDDSFGNINLLDLESSHIRPERLSGEVNLTPLIRERGGSIKLNDGYGWKDEPQLDFLFDEDETTAFAGDKGGSLRCADSTPVRQGIMEALGGNPRAQCRYCQFDLGGAFIIDRIVFYGTPRRRDTFFPRSFRLGTNDGNALKDGEREIFLTWRGKAFVDWNVVAERLENTDAVLEFNLPPEPVQTLYFEAPQGKWEIAEFEIYGSGAAPFASYVSSIVDLGGPAVLGELTWSGDPSAAGRIDLTSRGGDTADPNTYWRYTFRGDERSRFDAGGQPLSRTSYGRLEGGERAGITPDEQNWELWAPLYAYAHGRTDLSGHKPRQFLQFRADFHALPGTEGGRLDYLQFAVTQPPVARGVVAEITPAAVGPGEETRFTYKLLPQVLDGEPGFDTIEIRTPITPRVASVSISGVEVDWTRIREDADGLEVRIPRIDDTRSGELIEVAFDAEVFRFGTVFPGTIWDSERPYEVPQPVTPGNADDLADNNRLSVALDRAGPQSIGRFDLSSSMVTPNGDKANDALLIEFDLINVEAGGTGAATLELYSLTGQRIAVLQESPLGSGRIQFSWPGTDAAGQVLPPGIYVLRLAVETDHTTDAALRSVAVAY